MQIRVRQGLRSDDRQQENPCQAYRPPWAPRARLEDRQMSCNRQQQIHHGLECTTQTTNTDGSGSTTQTTNCPN